MIEKDWKEMMFRKNIKLMDEILDNGLKGGLEEFQYDYFPEYTPCNPVENIELFEALLRDDYWMYLAHAIHRHHGINFERFIIDAIEDAKGEMERRSDIPPSG